MSPKPLLILIITTALSACSTITFTPQRYSISADNNMALKAMGANKISVGQFTGPGDFDSQCRALGPIALPDGMAFEQYLQKALADELRAAGLFADNAPVVLSGALEQISFASDSPKGRWNIGLRITSSNDRSAFVAERYEFQSSFSGLIACKQTADAYLPAVQDLIGKLVKSPDFRGLVSPSS